jgi:hypothetical protein
MHNEANFERYPAYFLGIIIPIQSMTGQTKR